MVYLPSNISEQRPEQVLRVSIPNAEIKLEGRVRHHWLALSELAAHFQVYPDQITQWKSQLLERAASVFENGAASSPDATGTIRELHAKIGQLSVENVFFEGTLNKAGLWSAKR